MALPSLAEFNLAGGTALALLKGHRTSVDLDLFSQSEPDTEAILDEVIRCGKTDILLHKKNSTLLLAINDIKTDIIRHQYPQISEPILQDGLRLFGKPDIAAMKIGAIISRGSRKDFTDLYFLLNDYSLSEILEFYTEKYRQSEKFYILKSLMYFDDADREADLKMLLPVTWNDIKSTIISACSGIQ